MKKFLIQYLLNLVQLIFYYSEFSIHFQITDKYLGTKLFEARHEIKSTYYVNKFVKYNKVEYIEIERLFVRLVEITL